jgi:hypothetical protein
MSVAGEAGVARDGACCNLSLKSAAKSARAFMVSSPVHGDEFDVIEIIDVTFHYIRVSFAGSNRENLVL